MGKSASIPAREIFRDRMFWLNLAVILVGTAWLPLVSMEVTNADGVVQSVPIPVYRCYQALFMAPNLISAVAVFLHLAIGFGVSFFFRKWMLRGTSKA